MPKINFVHVAGGGIIAGIIINLCGAFAWEGVLGDAYMAQLGRSFPRTAIPRSMVWGYLIGAVAVWLYAALRSRYGRGVNAALIAGLMTALVGVALPNYAFWSFGLLGGRLMILASAIGFAEVVLATLAGAWMYERPGVDGRVATPA